MSTDYRFALLTNGSIFSQLVVECLLLKRFPPALVALPEYAPADVEACGAFNIQPPSPQRKIIALLPDVPFVYAPESSLRVLIESLEQFAIEFILVACWPYLLDTSIYQCADRPALNLHPSLLPDFRGPDPLNQQISSQQTNFGVTLHMLNGKFDQGDIIAQSTFKIPQTELNLVRLQQDCALLGVELFVEAINKYTGEGWQPIPQGCV
jgi:methionyl-tRNA formyltransferase